MSQDTVLVVEGDVNLRSLLQEVLEFKGMQVQTAGSCDEALASLSTCRIDLIISDINLPDESGYSLLQRWRAQELAMGRQPLPAIAISSLDLWEFAPLARAAGFQTTLKKPFEFDELWIMIVQHLAAGERG